MNSGFHSAVDALYRSCQKNHQKQCVVVSCNVGDMTLGDDTESNEIFRGSIIMRGVIAADGLPDSETRIACLDSALVMS